MEVIYLVFLHLLHVFGGILWAGWAFILITCINPATQAAGPEGGKFMQTLLGKTKLLPTMIVAPLLVIVTGILLYWSASEGFSAEWIVSGSGNPLTLGSLAGLLAFVCGLAISRPATVRMGALSREIQSAGGPPSAALLADLRAQQKRVSTGGLYTAILLVVPVVGMAMAVGFAP